MPMTTEQLTATATAIRDLFSPEMICQMHDLPDGAETLRLIVRDNVGGAADKITDALWAKL